jgi:hypothetical protein
LRILILIGFGLLPLWANVAAILYAIASNNNDLAFVAMWALAVAVPACVVTLAMAGASIAAHNRTDGSAARKSGNAIGILVTATVACIFVGLALWGREKDKQTALRAEARVVEAYAAREPSVVAAVGESRTSKVVTTQLLQDDPRPSVYGVEVQGSRTLYAFIGVSRRGSQRNLSLLCVREQLVQTPNPCQT